MQTFSATLRSLVSAKGGAYNAHLHLDRAGTLGEISQLLGSSSWAERLERKHSMIELIHSTPAYSSESLSTRAKHYTDKLIEFKNSRIETFIDVTNDGVGLRALQAFAEVRSSLGSQVELRLGAYNPLGFIKGDNGSIDTIKSALPHCDFIGGLPERDDTAKYADHIGFESSCNLLYELALAVNMDFHVHVDQRNDPHQTETLRLLKAISGSYQIPKAEGETRIWLVHFISPSRYEESRFQELAHELASLRIGVICCPSAALSMRQLRPRCSPTSNSIARVLDLCAAGVHVRLGSDNIEDVASPAGTPDLIDEAIDLCNAERFYNLDIISSITAGATLSQEQILVIKRHLEENSVITKQMANEL